jgi:hypothetical protein
VEKEFIPYEQALALKELGFDEPCFRGWYLDESLYYHPDSDIVLDNPTFSQAFRWFREKYRLNSTIIPIENEWYFLISKKGETLTLNRPRQCYRNTYEETELECLKKLIEIVKEK